MAITLDPATKQRIQHELDRRRTEEEWYARPRNSTREGRARAIALLERNAAPANSADAYLR